MADGMNVKDRYKAKQGAAEEAYYKGMEAPQTKMVDTGNGFTQVQTNTDKNGQVNAPVQNNKQTTLQNYKPEAEAQQAQPEAEAQQAQPKEEVPQAQAQVQQEVQPEANAEAQSKEDVPDVKVTVPEVDEEMMDESGINPQNSEEQNKEGTENALGEITGRRNKDGTYTPLNKAQYADGIQRFGIFATIASIGLAVLTRGAFPPVDFSAITGLNDSYAKYLEGIDNYNKYIRKAQSENAYEAERAKGSQENADKSAQLNAAGEDHSKETDAKWEAYLENIKELNAEKKAKLDSELEAALQGILTDGQLAVINANTEAQKALLELMYTQDVNRLSDTAKASLDLTDDELNKVAKFNKSLKGMTHFENILKVINTGVNVANAGANLINSSKPGINVNTGSNTGANAGSGTGSDAGTKEFFKRMIKF